MHMSTFVSLFLYSLFPITFLFCPSLTSFVLLSISLSQSEMAVLTKMDVCIPRADLPLVTWCSWLTPSCLSGLMGHCLRRKLPLLHHAANVYCAVNHMGAHTFFCKDLTRLCAKYTLYCISFKPYKFWFSLTLIYNKSTKKSFFLQIYN